METARKIRQGLKKFHGAITDLARQQGCTTEWVRQVLDGKANDPALLLAASQFWCDLEKERDKQLRQAEQLAAEAEQYTLAFA